MSDSTGKVNCAIIGSGFIGTDLMYKMLRSDRLRPFWLVGIDPDSEGLALGASKGLNTTSSGVDGLLPYVSRDNIQIVFDATSAKAHLENARKLSGKRVVMIDLTPAAIGPFCVPPVNLDELIESGEANVNMVSCGGQSTIPIVAAISSVQPVEYAEIVATLASKGAGPGTRQNIDEFTRTTARGIESLGKVERGKAIIILNPAEPPLVMRNTVHCIVRGDPKEIAIRASIEEMIESVRGYVPGYRLKNGPVFDGRRVSVFLEVAGLGEYLPSYAGNLDIMTSAGLRTAEKLAGKLAAGRFVPK